MGQTVKSRSEQAQARKSIELVEKALAAIRAGKMVILTDDEDRENEGDLVLAAEKVTPEAINFMATHARGLICLTLTQEKARRLNLPLMVQDNLTPFQTAFTVSIEAAKGVSTGISARDRAVTIRAAVHPNAKPTDLVRPGHVFPLIARDGGVLVRTGQTEGSVDLARLAGLNPSGVICEIMNPDGTMARRPDLVKFARKHGLVLLSVADIIRYRLEREQLVERVEEAELAIAGLGTVTAIRYRSQVDRREHVALVKGTLDSAKPTLVRMHTSCLMGDAIGFAGCDCGRLWRKSLERVGEEGTGVLVYLNRTSAARLGCTHKMKEEVPGTEVRLREFGVGAQILRDLGLRELRLLTNSPKKIIGVQGYGLSVVERVGIDEETGRRSRAARSGRPSRVLTRATGRRR